MARTRGSELNFGLSPAGSELQRHLVGAVAASPWIWIRVLLGQVFARWRAEAIGISCGAGVASISSSVLWRSLHWGERSRPDYSGQSVFSASSCRLGSVLGHRAYFSHRLAGLASKPIITALSATLGMEFH